MSPADEHLRDQTAIAVFANLLMGYGFDNKGHLDYCTAAEDAIEAADAFMDVLRGTARQ